VFELICHRYERRSFAGDPPTSRSAKWDHDFSKWTMTVAAVDRFGFFFFCFNFFFFFFFLVFLVFFLAPLRTSWASKARS